MEVDGIHFELTVRIRRCYFLDLAGIIKNTVKPPNTFRELAKKVIREIPKTYESIYIAWDTYRAASIHIRRTRGEGDKFVIRNSNIRISADFKNFLSSGENKKRMFELMEEVWAESEAEGTVAEYLKLIATLLVDWPQILKGIESW